MVFRIIIIVLAVSDQLSAFARVVKPARQDGMAVEMPIRRKSNQAVAHWWAVDVQTMSKWRHILSVWRATEGTHRLHSEYVTDESGIIKGRRKAVAKPHNPQRREKIAAARRDKPHPPHVVQNVA